MLMCMIRFDTPYNTELLFTLNVPDKHTEDEDQLGQSEEYLEFVE